MNSTQRAIKYIAMAFAILLAVGIISFIASIFTNIISGITGESIFNEKRTSFDESFTDVRSLDVNGFYGDLFIKTGNSFRVEASNVPESLKAKNDNGTLVISSKSSHSPFSWLNFTFHHEKARITLYLPEDFKAESVRLDGGAGSMYIDKLNAARLTINAGAGNIHGENMTADNVKVDGGVGNVTLTGVSFRGSDFNSGVGSLRVEGELLGNNILEGGIGDINLQLKGNGDNYNIDANSGIGSVRINGDKVSGSYKNNINADNSVKVDGGIGSIRINFIG